MWSSYLQVIEQKIQCMRRTVAEIQRCKPDLGLPERAETTMAVFAVVDQLQTLLLELEKVRASLVPIGLLADQSTFSGSTMSGHDTNPCSGPQMTS